MKQLIKWEEAAMFALSIVVIAPLPYAWYWWLVWILAPDLSMIAYLGGNVAGAMGYGLKYFTGFRDTHLGKIGKQRQTPS
jgi:hypothetical protein